MNLQLTTFKQFFKKITQAFDASSQSTVLQIRKLEKCEKMRTNHDGDHEGDLPVPLHLLPLLLITQRYSVQARLKYNSI